MRNMRETHGTRRSSSPVLPSIRRYLVASAVLTAVVVALAALVVGPGRLRTELASRVALAPPPVPALPSSPVVLGVISIAIAAFLAPLALYSRRISEVERSIEENTLRVVREFLGLLRSGYSVVDAVKVMSMRDYGPLNVFIETMNRLLATNHTFEEAFTLSIEPLPPRAKLYLLSLRDAYDAGGRAIELAGSLSSVIASINALEELRRSSLRSYTYMLAISVVMFAAVSAVTVYLASSLWGGGDGFVRPLFTPQEIAAMLFYISIWISLFSGLIAGKLIAGTVRAGFWYAFFYYLLVAITLFATQHLVGRH